MTAASALSCVKLSRIMKVPLPVVVFVLQEHLLIEQFLFPFI